MSYSNDRKNNHKIEEEIATTEYINENIEKKNEKSKGSLNDKKNNLKITKKILRNRKNNKRRTTYCR